MAKRVTMNDIAQAAGVSQATVSLVLNEVAQARISEETALRVRAAAAALGYEARRSLPRGGRSRVIGLMIDELASTPFAAPLILGARDEAAAQGALLAVVCTGADPAAEAAALAHFTALPLIGVIQATLVTRRVTPAPGLAALPGVLLNCHAEGPQPWPSVLPDDFGGARAAVAALAALGHTRIAHLTGEDWGEASRDRLAGYRAALVEAGLVPDPALVVGPTWTVDSGRAAAHHLMDLADPPTALFCFNDRVAIGALSALAMRGLSVPRDVSVAGFDNEDLVVHLTPPLSTVQLPHDEMGRRAVTLLAEGAPGPARHIVDCPLVLRASCAAPLPYHLRSGLGLHQKS